jgi:hypothetical protein
MMQTRRLRSDYQLRLKKRVHVTWLSGRLEMSFPKISLAVRALLQPNVLHLL